MLMKKFYKQNENGTTELNAFGKAMMGALIAYESLLQMMPVFGQGSQSEKAKQKADETFFANNQQKYEQSVESVPEYRAPKGLVTLTGDTISFNPDRQGSVDDMIKAAEGKANVQEGIQTLVSNDGTDIQMHPQGEYVIDAGRIIAGEGNEYGIMPYRPIQEEVKDLARDLKQEIKGYSFGQIYSALMNITRRHLSNIFKEIDEEGNKRSAVPHTFLDANGNPVLGYFANEKDIGKYVPEMRVTPQEVKEEARKLFSGKKR
ncbi:hypothetical protein D6764_02645 [Candidatus Woesearchaeota archaeon]|nr:MAG: hypothetical protein D6764_02645 [Candidatus Woesearchaeota archaeon]